MNDIKPFLNFLYKNRFCVKHETSSSGFYSCKGFSYNLLFNNIIISKIFIDLFSDKYMGAISDKDILYILSLPNQKEQCVELYLLLNDNDNLITLLVALFYTSQYDILKKIASIDIAEYYIKYKKEALSRKNKIYLF